MAMDDKKRERLSPAPQTLDKSEPGGVSTEEKEACRGLRSVRRSLPVLFAAKHGLAAADCR